MFVFGVSLEQVKKMSLISATEYDIISDGGMAMCREVGGRCVESVWRVFGSVWEVRGKYGGSAGPAAGGWRPAEHMFRSISSSARTFVCAQLTVFADSPARKC